MVAPSSLISKLESVLRNYVSYHINLRTTLKVRIGLRNIKVHLVCVRNLGDIDDNHAMQSLFSRIEAVIGRISSAGDDIYFSHESYDDLRAVNRLAKEVDDEIANTIPNHLTLDDVVEVVDSLLDNIADFWYVVKVCLDQALMVLRDAMDEFEVQARFLRDFLLFAKRAGAEIHHLLNLIRPFLWGVACAFQTKFPCPMNDDQDWVEEVQSRFPRNSLHVFQFCTQALLSMSALACQTDDNVLKDFLSSLISLFWHLLQYHRHHPHHSVNLKTLYECLRLSRFILKQHRQTNRGGFDDQIGVLIRDSGILICSLYLTNVDPQTLSDLLQRFEVVKAYLPLVSHSPEANALDFGDSTSVEDMTDGKLQIDTALTSLESSSSTPRDAGFQKDEVTSILDRLLRGSKELRIVPITGMAGLGKTTFALKIYNHPIVRHNFQARAWCTISQVLDKRQVLLRLLQQVQPGDYIKLDEDKLANKLRQSLKRKRYLILLDDVWNPQVLESFRPSFDDDNTHSRVVLTSRLHAIVPHALPDEQPHFLRQRSENECLEIIVMKLSHLAGSRTELGKFAKLCKGLPLTAVLIAGLLSTTMQEGWDGILDHLNSCGISNMEQCKIALELSYKHLPDDLKPCFIYFGIFPEDKEICAQNLIRLWIAEGFMASRKELLKKRIEDIARDYLDNLIQRNSSHGC